MSKTFNQKAEEFLKSRDNSGKLTEIIACWDEHPKACISAVENIFIQLLKRQDMIEKRKVSLDINERSQVEAKYVCWLKERYEEVWEKLSNSIANIDSRQSTQIQALLAAFNLIAAEGKFPIEALKENVQYYFPINRLKCVLTAILSLKMQNGQLVNKFLEFAKYNDVLHFAWISLSAIVHKGQPTDDYIKIYLEFLQKLPLPLPERSKTDQEKQELICGVQNDIESFYFDETIKKSVNRIWARIHQWKLTPTLHKQLLILLLEKIMPHLDKPILLTDYLMYSLNSSGSISLLALQGIAILVTKHNIEYPDIYTKLYSLLEPDIFYTKQKARLFYLTDLFLSSTHIPEAMVAAFAKRLSRLALVAPPEDISVIFLLVSNLLQRFPGLKKLVNYTEEQHNIVGDPYDMDEKNPVKSKALSSSLWEIKALQSHVLPGTAKAARFVSKSLPSVEHDLSDVLEQTSKDIFNKEMSAKFKEVAMTFEKPKPMRLAKDEWLHRFWKMT